MVGNIKALLMGVYAYFNHSPKRNLKKWKLAKAMETKGLNILWNIKIQWMNIIIPSKAVLEKFMTLLVKMAQDSTTNKFAAVNYELLCDVDTIMGFICMILMLEFVQILSKYVQSGKMLVCDFVNNVKLCQADLHKKYCDEDNKYSCMDFFQLKNFINHTPNPLHGVVE